MPMMGDGDSLSDVNKPFKPETEEEEEEEEEEESRTSGMSTRSVGGGRCETMDSELIVDAKAALNESPVVAADEVAAAEEGGGETIIAQSEVQPVETKTEEESHGAGDAEGEEAMVTDTVEMPMYTQPKMETMGDELFDELKLETESKEEFKPEVDANLEMVVSQSEAKIEMKADQEFTQVVDHEVELVVADVGDTPQVSEQMDGMEAFDDKSEGQVSDGKNNKAAGEVENRTVDSCVVENHAVVVRDSDNVNEEKVDAAVSDSDVWDAEKEVGSEEEKADAVITKEVVAIEKEKSDMVITDIPITEVKMDMKMITEVNACAVGIGEQEQIPESSAYIGDLKEGLISATKMMEHESMSMDLLGSPTLDEPVNMTENNNAAPKEDCLLEEDPEKDIEAKTETEVESELNAVLKETQLADAEVVTAENTEVMDHISPGDDGKMDPEETNSDDADEPTHDLYDSPAALEEEEDEAVAADVEAGTQDTEMETEMDIPESEKSSGGKRKRGKLSKSPSNSMAATKSSSRKTVGEDVCFICFDGGELVLCDRRGCPKAYHPSCVNRDEAFFRSKGRWNCGWHLCSICEKNARYMCYTCTYSLCKSCTKDAAILCVRGNKGFCETCMKTVKLIENNEQGNENTQIDFNDRSSWEYLFKDYYIELKAKLSLSSVDIAEAKNSWKGADISSGPSKRESSKAPADANDGGSGSDNSIENIETIRPKRRKTRKSKALSREYDLGFAAGNNSEWASKELLEFVSHMRDGDTNFLSQYDVQELLLEYIKINKLRDPRRKSQIICDARLGNLFGKPRVGHFEMLKLLESHFLVRDEQNDDFQGSVVDTESNLLDVDGNADPMTKGVKDRQRKSRKKSNRGPQSNLDDYAAIDMHNIGLIYLRRKLMEDLLEDVEVFRDKVIGTFVRIRISGSNQKQDLYRLVPVVGTSKGVEPYKIGKKSTDTMVEILNLDKTEIISIDTISNQEFTEEECKRLRQSIKCGLISRLTVGEILDKTVEIQTARVNDWLESEVLRLSHLRDRASDLGRRKELRECVEKLQLLKTPEERRRRLDEIPEIHADPKMDPSYESDDNDSENEDSRRDAFMRSKGISRRGRAPISPGSDNPTKQTNKIWESSKYASGSSFSINPSHIGEIVNENSWNIEREKETEESRNLLAKQSSASITEYGERSPHPVSRFESFPGVTPSTVTSQTPLSAAGAVETAVKINESEKIWHYKDPSGKVQGPFSMVQLRKWNNTGYFPADLKIWRDTQKEDNSIPLADALKGKFPKELPVVDNIMSADNKQKSIMDQNSGSLTKLSAEKWRGNDTTNLPSPTPKRSKVNNSGWHEEERGVLTGASHQTPGGVNGLLSSPTPVLPNMGTLSSAASVINTVVQTAPFSPTPNPQVGTLTNSTVSLHAQSNTTSELSPHAVQMHSRGPATGQPQGYFWGTSNVQNSPGSFSNAAPAPTGGLQPDVWRSAQASKPNMPPPVTQNATWGAWPAENNNAIGVRPENPNMGWGTLPPNPNMGGGNLPPVNNTNMNWGPPPMPVPMPGYGNPSWGAPPVQGPVVGNGWGPPSGNAGTSLPAAVQVPPPQGNLNQGFGPPGKQVGSWGGGGEPNHMGGQFSGQRGGRGRDSGFSGGPRPWNNRQSSFVGGGGGGFRKGGMVCPYNQNGRCRKGLECDYMHT